MMLKPRCFTCAVVVCAFFRSLLCAQSTTAQVTGTVSDATGAGVPAAQITVAGDENGVVRQTAAATAGTFTMALLPPGKYHVTVIHDGFRPIAQSGLELLVNQVARLDFSLQVGDVSEKVEVAANAPLLESETSSLGQVIDQKRIEGLPLNGRVSFRLVQLTPGVSTPSGSSGQFGDTSVGTFDDSNISINGGRSQSNAVLIDGVPANTGFLNLFTTIPSVDATQEFKVQSNGSSAEYGRFGGGVLNVSTRSGTNQIHGTLFEFLRNSKLDSNDFFNNRAGRPIPAFRMNQFGGVVGGPITLGRLYDGANRTFFFANYEGTRWRRGSVYQDTVPTLLQRQGDFSQTFNAQGQLIAIYDPATTVPNPAGGYTRTQFPGNIIPKSRFDPVGAALLQYYPLPDLNGDPTTHASNFISNARTRVNKDDRSIRVDENVTQSYRALRSQSISCISPILSGIPPRREWAPTATFFFTTTRVPGTTPTPQAPRGSLMSVMDLPAFTGRGKREVTGSIRGL